MSTDSESDAPPAGDPPADQEATTAVKNDDTDTGAAADAGDATSADAQGAPSRSADSSDHASVANSGDDASAHPTEDDATGDPTGHDASGDPSDGKDSTVEEADSASKDDDDCAEIPCATHAVLTAELKLFAELPLTLDEAGKLPHTFTLCSDDGSYSMTRALASDCTAGDVDGTSVLTFDGLTEGDVYTLKYAVDDATYVVFESVTYDEQLVPTLVARGDESPSTSDTEADPPWIEDSDDDGSSDDASSDSEDSGDTNGVGDGYASDASPSGVDAPGTSDRQ